MYKTVFAGIGGMGVLLTGEILTRSAASQYKNVLWVPNYTSSNRGAPCDCTVILSDEDILSPLQDQVDTVVIMAALRLKDFEHRVKPGGNLMLETYQLTDSVERKDLKLIEMPIMETAVQRGVQLGANMITLGMYNAVTRAVDPGHIDKTIKEKFGKKEKVYQSNMELFELGTEMGKAL